MPAPPVIEVDHLRTYFHTEDGLMKAVDDISFRIDQGRVLGIVGESGSGKSVTSLSIMRLLSSNARIESGKIALLGRDLVGLPERQMQSIRGRDISMIFQEPMTSLNPVFTIGRQVMEIILAHEPATPREQANRRAVDILTEVGIPDPAARMTQYPHELSGGMRQRVMIAIALALNPALLIADEPTTALDVTIQAQILDLMLELKARQVGGAILLITHNLAVVAETCDRVAVMYGGKVQEVAPVRDLFRNPLHPYTRGLLASLPRVDGERATRTARAIR